MNARLQSYSYAIATAVLVLVVGWAGQHTWQELRQLHRGFSSVQIEDVFLARQVEGCIHELNEIVLRANLHRDATEKSRYEKTSADLLAWMNSHKENLSTPEQQESLNQIAAAFAAYSSSNRWLMDKSMQSSVVAEVINSNAAPVLKLCRTLEDSERAEQTQFMNDSQRALAWIQELLAVMLVLLALSAGTAIVAIRHGVIDPLRLKLKETRALAERNEKLASLGTLAAGVAHEIRNPLTAINVRLHSLKKNLAADSSEQEDAAVIDHEIQRLERIVQGFLQFARPAEPKFLPISADSLLTKVQTLFQLQLEKASIQLNVASLPDLWLRADPQQMEQVLINLVQNAAQSIEGHGAITLRARTGEKRLGGGNRPVVMLDVMDTGKGISPEVRKRIFDPFFTTKQYGTGLGLAISLRIVEKHGGTLECHSEVNRGTTFTIVLPHTKPEENNELTI